MTVERRKRKRVPFYISTDFILPTGKIIQPYLHDISMEGFSLLTDEAIDIGYTGELVIHLKCGTQRKDIHAVCQVVRRLQASPKELAKGIGLKIIEIDSDSSILLYNLIKYQDVS